MPYFSLLGKMRREGRDGEKEGTDGTEEPICFGRFAS